MYDHFYDAGVQMHNNGELTKDTQHDLNATARQSVIVLHHAKSLMEGSPESKWGSEIRTDIEHFDARYNDYWTHLGTEIENDPEGKEWRKQLAQKTMTLAKSIGDILGHLPPPATVTTAESQPSEPPTTSRTDQLRKLSTEALARLGKLRRKLERGKQSVMWDGLSK
jgi:hypothetical protein